MPRFCILILVLFISSTLFSQEAAINAELKQADKFTKDGKYEEALQHIDNALEIEPLDLIALEKKVNIMILSDKEKDIFKEINSLIESYPQQPEYYYLRALIYLYRQKSSKAIEDLDNAEYYLIPEKYWPKLYMNRGTAYYYFGDFASAEKNFQATIELDPRNAAAYHSWGMLKYEEQLYDEAINYFNKSIQYQDNNAIAYYNLGMAYYKIGERKNACYNLNQSCILKNKNACKIYILECSE
jgi:tetratricopeptide (TPR) repeat protein